MQAKWDTAIDRNLVKAGVSRTGKTGRIYLAVPQDAEILLTWQSTRHAVRGVSMASQADSLYTARTCRGIGLWHSEVRNFLRWLQFSCRG